MGVVEGIEMVTRRESLRVLTLVLAVGEHQTCPAEAPATEAWRLDWPSAAAAAAAVAAGAAERCGE